MIAMPWTQSVLPIGVDIGAGGVRLMQLRSGRRGLSVAAAARVDLDDALADGEDLASLEPLAQAIGMAVRAGGFASREAVLALDDRLVRSRSFRLPEMPAEELRAAVELDGPEKLGFGSADECVVDALPAGTIRQGESTKQEVIYVGVPRRPVERLIDRLGAIGVRTSSVEPGFCAAARAFARTFQRERDRSAVRVVVDIGWRSTAVLLLRGPALAFHKHLEFGGVDLERACADRLGLEPEAVGELRRRRMRPGSDVDDRADRAMFNAVRPLMSDLAHEIRLCLRYYSVTFRGAQPETCFLVGGESPEPGLAGVVGSALGMPTEVGDPLMNVEAPGHVTARVRGWRRGAPASEWTVAAGLSLRGWKPSRRGSDWTPRDDREESAEPAGRGAEASDAGAQTGVAA
jgi:type IV pilus assembly protein PilM